MAYCDTRKWRLIKEILQGFHILPVWDSPPLPPPLSGSAGGSACVEARRQVHLLGVQQSGESSAGSVRAAAMHSNTHAAGVWLPSTTFQNHFHLLRLLKPSSGRCGAFDVISWMSWSHSFSPFGYVLVGRTLPAPGFVLVETGVDGTADILSELLWSCPLFLPAECMMCTASRRSQFWERWLLETGSLTSTWWKASASSQTRWDELLHSVCISLKMKHLASTLHNLPV